MKSVELDPKARAEIRAAVQHLDALPDPLGDEFIAEVAATLADIERFPALGPPVNKKGHRFRRLRRFHYVIYYREEANVIRVVAVAHFGRRPNYWDRHGRN